MKHLDTCHVCNAKPCPAPTTLHSESVGEHWWSGWPGAYCMKCGAWDPMEACFADDCRCSCHPFDDLLPEGEDVL